MLIREFAETKASQVGDIIVSNRSPDMAKVLASTKNKVGIEIFGSDTPQGLKADMHRAGIEKAVVLPVAKTTENVRQINDWITSISGDGLLLFGAIHPLMEVLAEELDLLAYQGFLGVKVVPAVQHLYPDDP